MKRVMEIGDAEFENEVLHSETPVFVDFWAPWCGPCRVVAPIVEELAGIYENIKFIKINVDDNPVTPSKYGIRSIPTLMIFKDGKPQGTIIGAVPKREIEELIKKAL